MRGKTFKEKMKFLAKIMNENIAIYKAETENDPKSLSEYNKIKQKEQEIEKKLIKTDQPKPISKRIQGLLENYRKKKYKLREPKKNEGEVILKEGEDIDLGKYVIKDKIDPSDKIKNEYPLAVKKLIHQQIINERAAKKVQKIRRKR